MPRLLPALLLVLALLAGCGGGDDAPQTREGFVNDADGVCASLAGQFADAGSKEPGTAAEVADANNVLADLYEELGDRLEDVRLPASGSARSGAQAYVSSVSRADPLLARLREASANFLEAAKSNDAAKLAGAGNDVRVALDGFRASRAAANRMAIEYGLNLCGNLD